MASSKTTDLGELTTSADEDILYIVDDPSGTPVSKKITKANLLGDNKVTGTQDMFIPAGAFIPRTTNGGTIADRELPTNDIMIRAWKADTSTSEGAGIWWVPPANWDAGTITFAVHWTSTGGGASETIDFDLAGRCYTDDDAGDQALGTAQNVTDTRTADDDIQITSFSSAITLAGTVAKNKPVYLEISRDVASDTLAVDAEILGIVIRYTIDDGNSS